MKLLEGGTGNSRSSRVSSPSYIAYRGTVVVGSAVHCTGREVQGSMYYVLHGAAHAAATAATAAPAPGLCSLRRRWHYTTLCYVVLAI